MVLGASFLRSAWSSLTLPFLHPGSLFSSGFLAQVDLRTSEGLPQILPSSSFTLPLSALVSPAHSRPVDLPALLKVLSGSL